MALNTKGLKDTIEELLKNNQSIASNAKLTEKEQKKVIQDSLESLASGLASAIEVFVKSGQVTTEVKTTGSATTQAGTGTGKIT